VDSALTYLRLLDDVRVPRGEVPYEVGV